MSRPSDERLAWLTGFTGSAGFCAVLPDVAGVFVDGRYRVQIRRQVAAEFTPVDWPETKLADWLSQRLGRGDRVGFDPWLHTVGEIEALRKALTAKGIETVEVPNLIDRIWDDRPAPPAAAFTAYPEANAGRSSADKRAEIAAALTEAGQRAVVLTLPDSIAWLLNIRGQDTARNPVPQAFAIVHDDGRCRLFARPGKAHGVADHLGPEVEILPEDEFLAAVARLDGPVRIDPKSCPVAVAEALAAAEVEAAHGRRPDAAAQGAQDRGRARRRARGASARRGGDGELPRLARPRGAGRRPDRDRRRHRARRLSPRHQRAARHLVRDHRRRGRAWRDRPLPRDRGDRPAGEPGELLLVDSGGQYLDGTTDITRTISIGAPPEGAADAYTRVLQGMIAISRCRFPKGVGGQHLDALARYPLWLAGLDYDHGTGHGVGAYLSVHEGPQGLSRRSEALLEPGMIVSNEPGYYREGQWGIRIENLVVVREAPALPGQDDRPWRDFETLTYVPLDRRLIVPELLSPAERDWINAYHADTVARIGPRVEAATLGWLEAACAPI